LQLSAIPSVYQRKVEGAELTRGDSVDPFKNKFPPLHKKSKHKKSKNGEKGFLSFLWKDYLESLIFEGGEVTNIY